MWNKKARLFELRNGMIIKEKRGETTCGINGYIDDYEVIKGNENHATGDYLCLLLKSEGMPTGGARGNEYDIVKEKCETRETLFSKIRNWRMKG